MCVEIVLDKLDDFGVGKMDIAQIAQEMGIINAGALIGDLNDPAAFQRRETHEQIGNTGTFVFIIMAYWLAGFHRDRLARFLDKLFRCLVQADQRPLGVVRLRINVKHILHRGNESGVLFWGDYPVFAAMRFEFVFFKVRPTVLKCAASTISNSTTLSASRRIVQRA